MNIILFLLAVILTSCSVVAGSKLAIKGDQCISENNVEQALELYLQAVEENPNSLNLSRVASAYLTLGDYMKAWPYAHKAVFLNYDNEIAVSNLVILYTREIVPRLKIDEWGQTEEKIIHLLGEPDSKITSQNKTFTYFVYGNILLEFKMNHLRNHFWVIEPKVSEAASFYKDFLSVFKLPN